jgi:uncharacterized membrane protein YeaQ/YmgE (transglycosylase-associated protein family)
VLLAVFAIMVLLFVVLPLIGMALWALFSTIVVGLVIGALGRLVVPGPQPIGVLATLGAGLCGSIFGGFLGQHVIGLGHLATVLVEVGLAALIVALLTAAGRRHAPSAMR